MWTISGEDFQSTVPCWTGAAFKKYGMRGGVARVSKVEENTVWLINGNRDLIRVRNQGNTVATQEVKSFPLAGGGRNVPPASSFAIADIAPDPRNPRRVYVSVFGSGWSVLWMGEISGSGGNETMVWTDITENLPRWQDCAVYVSKFTGDVWVGGGQGIWVFPAPANYKNDHPDAVDSVWPDLAQPVRLPLAV